MKSHDEFPLPRAPAIRGSFVLHENRAFAVAERDRVGRLAQRAVGPAYTRSILHEQGDGVYIAKIDPPAKGWTASFVELTFDIGAPTPLKLTTAVRVLPDRLPYADLDPAKAPYEPLKDAAK